MSALLKDHPALDSPMRQSPEDIRRDYPVVESTNVDSAAFARGDLAGWLCYRESLDRNTGILCVSADHRDDSRVLDYEDRLVVLKKRFTTHVVSVGDIVALQADAGRASVTHEVEQGFMLHVLGEAARRGASDVHIQIREKETIIRFRVHGRVRTFWKRTVQEGRAWLNSLWSTMCFDQSDSILNDRKDGRASLKPDFARQIGLTGARLQTRPKKGWMYAVLRLMYQEASSEDIESIGFLEDKHLPQLKYLLARTHGIVIVSGATGHGKSRTLKTFVERYCAKRRQEVNFITIEDPTEYDISGESVVQTPLIYDREELGADTRAWALAIKSVLRLDPDAIMPGELRDLHSALGAAEAALTGHLCLSTLHVYDATAILMRLRGMGVPTDLLFNPSIFIGLINQSLVATLCPDCSVPLASVISADRKAPAGAIDPDVLARLLATVRDVTRVRLRSFDGCDCTACGGVGERGRRLVAEICVPNADFMEVYEGQGMLKARKYWVDHMGGFTKSMHLQRLIADGIVDPTTAEEIVGPLDLEKIELRDGMAGGASG